MGRPVSDIAEDRWTCPHCHKTTIANDGWQRQYRVRFIRMTRDLHPPQCTALARVVGV